MKATIISHTAVPSGDLGRVGLIDTLLVYTKDNGDVGSVIIPSASPTDAEIVAAIKATEDQGSRLVGRTLEA